MTAAGRFDAWTGKVLRKEKCFGKSGLLPGFRMVGTAWSGAGRTGGVAGKRKALARRLRACARIT